MELRTTVGVNGAANTNEKLATNFYVGTLTNKNDFVAGAKVGLSASIQDDAKYFLNGKLAYNSDEGICNPADGMFANGSAEIGSQLKAKSGSGSRISTSYDAEAGYRINSINEYHENISAFGSITQKNAKTTLTTGGKIEYNDDNSGVYTALGIQTNGQKASPYFGAGIKLSLTEK